MRANVCLVWRILKMCWTNVAQIINDKQNVWIHMHIYGVSSTFYFQHTLQHAIFPNTLQALFTTKQPITTTKAQQLEQLLQLWVDMNEWMHATYVCMYVYMRLCACNGNWSIVKQKTATTDVLMAASLLVVLLMKRVFPTAVESLSSYRCTYVGDVAQKCGRLHMLFKIQIFCVRNHQVGK